MCFGMTVKSRDPPLDNVITVTFVNGRHRGTGRGQESCLRSRCLQTRSAGTSFEWSRELEKAWSVLKRKQKRSVLVLM